MKTIERLIPLGLLLILGAEQYFYGGAWQIGRAHV